MWRVAFVLICFASLLNAQQKMNVAQVRSFVRSSIQLGHEDRKVADYLKKIQLGERLEEPEIAELEGAGAGPKTLAALRELAGSASSLPQAMAIKEPAAVKVAPPVIPVPSSREQDEILEKVRAYALGYDKQLPDFICTQVTRRYYDPAGLEFWHLSDTITARLSYFQNKEEKKVTSVNGRYQEMEYDRLGGATSTGEFGSLLKQVFEPATQTRFDWERWATLRGRRMYVFSYRVLQANSQWKIIYDKTVDVTPGYRGLIFIDRDTLQVMRITLEAEDIPPSFPVQQAATRLDYDYAAISEREFLLPLRAEIRMRSGKNLIKNDVEFRLYRKFGTESSIVFDTTPDALPSDTFEEKPAGAATPPKKK